MLVVCHSTNAHKVEHIERSDDANNCGLGYLGAFVDWAGANLFPAFTVDFCDIMLRRPLHLETIFPVDALYTERSCRPVPHRRRKCHV